MTDRLICFLGVGSYVPVHYQLGDRTTQQPETYVQAAIAELIGQPVPRIQVLATQLAFTTHWDKLHHRLGDHLDEPIRIPDGESEAQLWDVFAGIAERLRPGDRVWFDVTHGFRSLPVTAVLALTFYRHMLKLDIQGLYYGAFENALRMTDDEIAWADRNLGKERKTSKTRWAPEDLRSYQQQTQQHKTAPVFDLTPMLDLPAWAEGVAEWSRTGRADGLVERARPYLSSLQRQLKQDAPRALVSLPNTMEAMSRALSIVRHDQPGKLATELLQAFDNARSELRHHAALKPLTLIADDLQESVTPLATDNERVVDVDGHEYPEIGEAYLRRQARMSRWLLDRHRIVEATTVIRELVTSCAVYVARMQGVEALQRASGGPAPWHSERYRTTVDGLVQALCGHQPHVPSYPPQPDVVARVRAWLDTNADAKLAFKQVLDGIRDIRNFQNHAWTSIEATKRKFSRETYASLRGELLGPAKSGQQPPVQERVEKLVDTVLAGHPVDLPQTRTGFLNLSNHPIERWPATQVEAARRLGLGDPAELDGGMPLVDAEVDTPAVCKLASAIADRVEAAGAAGAFVATDPTLTAALVGALQARGVRCFAATTERVAQEQALPDGTVQRTSTYRFVRWREYPTIQSGE